MSPHKLSLFAFVSLLSLSSVACVVRARPVAVVQADVDANGEYVEPQQAEDEVVVVDQQPPDDQVEDPGSPPGRTHVWLRGRWVLTAHGWTWRRGHWVTAHAGRAWVPGHWVKRHHRWVWVTGHWQRR